MLELDENIAKKVFNESNYLIQEATNKSQMLAVTNSQGLKGQATNPIYGLNFDGDSQDRRFTLFECNEKNKYITKKIKDGWKKLTDYWASPTHISALFDYLNEYNIDLQIAEQRPISELYKTLICKNRSPFIYFMESFICKCEWREFEKYNNKTYMDTEHIIKEDDEYYNKTIEIKQNEFKNHINQWLDQVVS